ncbi:MAG: hypothetical protein HQ570_04040 [Candidatus Omnitrophica bacterium]|nr:hypothetical protein [Candidatus Omnitrophota bacterium]
MLRIKKVLNFFLLLLLTILSFCFLFTTKAKSLDIKTSDCIYISLNLKDPSQIGFELSFINKIDLKGEYSAENKSLKAKVSIKNLNLNQLGEYVKLPVAGYIQKGDLELDLGKAISLKGGLEANELKFATKDINLRGNIKLLGYFKILEQGLDYHINYQIKDGYFSKLKDITKIQAKGFFKKNELFLSKAKLIYKNLPIEVAGRIKDFSSPKIDLRFTGEPGNLTVEAQYNKEVEKLEIKGLAEAWGGKINFRAAVSLSDYKGSLDIGADGIDIAQAMHELNVAGKKPHGKLSLEANLRSVDLFKWKNLRGEGKILVSEGNIYQIDFLKGLGKFLSIPDFENIVFNEASSDLFFEGQEIFFENFQLNATQMNIEGKGKMTTVGNIDFLLFPQFSQELMNSSKGLQKYLTAFLGEGTLSVSISGTIKNPVYTTNISIIPALDKIEDIIDIFKDIF